VEAVGKVMEILGVLLSASGIVGKNRLARFEQQLRCIVTSLASWKGFHKFVGGGLHQVKSGLGTIGRLLYLIWVVLDWISIALSLVIVTLLGLRLSRLDVLSKIVDTDGLTCSTLVRVSLPLVALYVASFLIGILLLLLNPSDWRETIEQVWEKWLQKNVRWTRNLRKALGSFEKWFKDTLDRLRLVERQVRSQWLRKLFKISLRVAVLFLLGLPGLVIGILVIVVNLLSGVLSIYIDTVYFSILVVLFSACYLLVSITLLAGYTTIYSFLFPYYVLDRFSVRLKLESTLTILGIMLSVVGVLLQ